MNITLAMLPLSYDPGLRPSAAGLPSGLVDFLRSIGSGVLFVSFIIFAILLVVASIAYAASKTSGHSSMQKVSGGAIIFMLLGAFLAGGSSALVRWAGQAGSQIASAPALINVAEQAHMLGPVLGL